MPDARKLTYEELEMKVFDLFAPVELCMCIMGNVTPVLLDLLTAIEQGGFGSDTQFQMRKIALCRVRDGWFSGAAVEGDGYEWSNSMYLAACVLDNAGMIEHGSSMPGSWLTDKGKESIPLIREYLEREDEA